ncbi:uncharacterized protein [Heterodontus francisci]|uniref:uncharacterized protein n=1 Tax=Heterodontus francisci TaxID=7792 RepID=UPI00355B28BA
MTGITGPKVSSGTLNVFKFVLYPFQSAANGLKNILVSYAFIFIILTEVTEAPSTGMENLFKNNTAHADTTVVDIHQVVPVNTTVLIMATVALTSVTTVPTVITRLLKHHQQDTAHADTTVVDIHQVVPVITTVLIMATVALTSVTSVPTLITSHHMMVGKEALERDTAHADTTVVDIHRVVPVITAVSIVATVALTSVTTVPTLITSHHMIVGKEALERRRLNHHQQNMAHADTTVVDIHQVVPVITAVSIMATVALTSVTTVPTLITRRLNHHQQNMAHADTTVVDIHQVVPVITAVSIMATVALTSVTTVPTLITRLLNHHQQNMAHADTTVVDIHQVVPVITAVSIMATVALTSVTTVPTLITDTAVVIQQRLLKHHQQAMAHADTTVVDIHQVVPVITAVSIMATVALTSVTTVPTLITDTAVVIQQRLLKHHQQAMAHADTTVVDIHQVVPVITAVSIMATVALTSVTTVPTLITDTAVLIQQNNYQCTMEQHEGIWKSSKKAPETPSTGYGSCRYNCGGHSSGCSCDYSCQYNGNCCSDFCYYCSYINYGYCSGYSTEAPETPSTGYGSCRYNCGGHSSGCSCDYSCQYNGNCCSDFCYYCSYINYGYCSAYSTEAPETPSTGYGSCRYNCGGHSSGCSCDYSCQYNGNCCSDFCYYCSYINYGYCSAYSTEAPETPSTGYGSCRYNCGGHSSGCSCEYNCPYYGNCCPDFCDHCSYINYEYCSSFTTSPAAHGSCRYNCGGHSSGCSCDYNCYYYGNCCPDFCDHCPYINYGYCSAFTTSETEPPSTGIAISVSGGSCGGYLEGPYGSITSPNYPYFYPNNAQCTWYIRVDRNQKIKLQFTEIDLEVASSCQYDYIAIYDGPSTNSVLLSKICRGSNSTFISSSNSMTIYFRSDSSVYRHGFTAHYYSLSIDDDLLTCTTDYMEVKLSRSYLNSLGFDEHNLYLNDQNCRPIITANDVVFRIPLNSCGTERQGNNGSITYSNTIRSSPSDSVITRETNLQINIGCEVKQDTMFKIMYVANENMTGDIIENVTESSTFNVSMTFYDSPSFTWPVLEAPYYVDLRQNLYLQVNLHSSDTGLVVFVDTCTASPYSFDWTSRTYDLIKNGCVKDGTYETYPSPVNGVARFKFSAFKFLNLHSSVYLQCKLVVCKAYDYSSRCYRGCISRQRRATGSSKGITNVLTGPIELKKDVKYYEARELENKLDEADETTIQSSFPFVLSLLVLVAVVSVLVVTVLKLRRSQQKEYGYEQLGGNFPNVVNNQIA